MLSQTFDTNHPVTWHHIPEELRPQLNYQKDPKLVTCHLHTTQKILESDGEQFLENNTWNGEHFEKG